MPSLAAIWVCDSMASGVPHHESKLEYLKVGCIYSWPVPPTVLSFTACVFQIPCITDQQDKDPLCAAAVLLLALILLCFAACSTSIRPSSSLLKSAVRSCLHCYREQQLMLRGWQGEPVMVQCLDGRTLAPGSLHALLFYCSSTVCGVVCAAFLMRFAKASPTQALGHVEECYPVVR